jgi:hypothetical protein
MCRTSYWGKNITCDICSHWESVLICPHFLVWNGIETNFCNALRLLLKLWIMNLQAYEFMFFFINYNLKFLESDIGKRWPGYVAFSVWYVILGHIPLFLTWMVSFFLYFFPFCFNNYVQNILSGSVPLIILLSIVLKLLTFLPPKAQW